MYTEVLMQISSQSFNRYMVECESRYLTLIGLPIKF